MENEKGAETILRYLVVILIAFMFAALVWMQWAKVIDFNPQSRKGYLQNCPCTERAI